MKPRNKKIKKPKFISLSKTEVTSDPTITQITLPDERFYKVNEKFYPSVTWILDSYPKGIGFYQWVAAKGWDGAEAIKEAAGDRGSKVHNAIVDLINGKTVKWGDSYSSGLKSPELLSIGEYEALMSFVSFWKICKPKLIESETVCHSTRYGFAGTIDFVGIIDGKVTVLDWKTGSKIWPSHALQVGAYAYAIHEMKKYKIHQTGIVRLGSKHKNGYELKLYDAKESKSAFNGFLAVKNVFEIEHKDAQPRQWEIPEQLSIKVEKHKL